MLSESLDGSLLKRHHASAAPTGWQGLRPRSGLGGNARAHGRAGADVDQALVHKLALVGVLAPAAHLLVALPVAVEGAHQRQHPRQLLEQSGRLHLLARPRRPPRVSSARASARAPAV